MRIVYYVPTYLDKHQNLPGIANFCLYRSLYGPGVMPLDRTGVLKYPVRTKSLYPMPRMHVFSKTYEETCNERAHELLAQAQSLDALLYAFWSGGIDSTCLLISLLKNATAAQKERIVVLLSEESITEYPLFYHQHLR